MDRNEVLRSRLKRAVDNGFQLLPHTHFMTRDKQTGEMYGYETIIFDPLFAQALWGKDTLSPIYGDLENLSAPDYLWQYHLQEMVVADDRLAYLEANS